MSCSGFSEVKDMPSRLNGNIRWYNVDRNKVCHERLIEDESSAHISRIDYSVIYVNHPIS